jgi:hypothetical protein
MDEQHAGELAVRAGDRLQRHRGHAEDLAQRLLEMPQQLEVPLHLMVGLERMRQGEAGNAGDLLVEPRVVLHRARAERVHPRVDRHIELRQAREMPDDADLGDLQLFVDEAARQRRRQRLGIFRHVERRQLIAAPAAVGVLEDEPSASRGLCRRRHFFGFEYGGHLRSLATAAVSAAA